MTDPDIPTKEQELLYQVDDLKAKLFVCQDINERIELRQAIGERTQAIIHMRRQRASERNHEVASGA